MMRKSRLIFSVVLIFTAVMLTTMSISATSWMMLEPEEVLDRAEVVVSGRYDFTSDGDIEDTSEGSRFLGVDFSINEVYQGDVSGEIVVGIDSFDINWAEEVQADGGEFLLFLENSEEADFLVPVNGPIGMVQLNDGEMEQLDTERRAVYEGFLASAQETASSDDDTNPNDNMMLVWYGSAIVLIGIALLVLRHQRGKKNKMH